jgi:two-component system response regulator AtoC
MDALMEDGYNVRVASNCQDAKRLMDQEPADLLITDIKMPGGDGKNLIEYYHRKKQPVSFIVITGHPDEEIVKFTEEYSINSLLVKPFTARQLKYSVLRSFESYKNISTSTEPDETDEKKLGLVGISPYIKELRKKVQLLSQGNFPVLIQGESGTGKEIIAQALHKCSNRKSLSLFTVNCAAIPYHLEESEFFGYTKGAFTGAHTMKHGIIASADNSSLFLDEIGELSLEIQAKLLRVLDTGEFMRIGESISRKVDIRIISATNRNLEEMVKLGTFRQDLFFRLKGAIINTQPLRDHKEDIPLLINHFISFLVNDSFPKQITSDAIAKLVNYTWPGNVRELKHAIEHLAAQCNGLKKVNAVAIDTVIDTDDSKKQFEMSYNDAKENIVQNFERDYFTTLLLKFRGNLNQASKSAGMHRPNLIKKIKALSINPDDYRPVKHE